MGKMDGFNIRFRNSIGGLTFYKLKNETVVRQKRTKNPIPDRYFSQMVQRAKAGNVNKFYAATKGLLKEAFELDKPTSNAHAMFNKMNWAHSTVYLTKAECERGTTILFPYCVSCGTLDNPVGIATQGSKQVTDICLGTLAIDATTTVAQLASAIMENNGNRYNASSRITFVRATQELAHDDVPATVRFESHSVDLKIVDQNFTVWGHLGTSDGFTSTPVSRNGVTLNYLSCDKLSYSMVAWTHSMFSDDRTRVQVTTQYLTGDNPLLPGYETDLALYNSIVSLGGVNKENHYSPNYVSWKDFEKRVQMQVAGLAPDHSGSTGGGTGNTDPTRPAVTISGAVSPAGSGNVAVSPAQPVASGALVTLTASANSGKRFVRWSDGNTQNPRTVTATSTMSYTAIFEDTTSSGGGNNGGTPEIEALKPHEDSAK